MVLGSDNIKSGEKLRLNVPVTNTGKCDGEEVVQVYLKKNDDVEGPSKALRAFKRVHIPAGKTVDVEFDLGDKELVWWNAQSNTMCVSRLLVCCAGLLSFSLDTLLTKSKKKIPLEGKL